MSRRHSRALPHLLLSLLVLGTPALAQAAACTGPAQLTPGANDWRGWGHGYDNTRHVADGIGQADLSSLSLRWAYGFEGAGSVVGNPVVQGATLFIGVDSGAVHALDVASGCEHWTFQAPAGVRTAPSVGQIDGDWWVFFGDRDAQVYALDAMTGELRWRREVDSHPAAILTGSPQFVHLPGTTSPDRLLVPVSSSEEGIAAVPTYACCSFRGSVASLNAKNGELLWQTYTINQAPAATGDNTLGPSGGAIWSSPTVDVANNRLYVTTGDAYSGPVEIGTDAVIGMALDTGTITWIHQSTADDIWTVACMRPEAPDDCGPDHDYGSPAMLVQGTSGPLLVAGQKSGMVRGLTTKGGSTLWELALVENPTEFGGKIIWGGASDGHRAYFGLGTGGIAAIDLDTQHIAWSTPLAPDAARARHVGQDGPLTLSGDLVFSGGWDGILRALDTASGKVLWQFDTATEFTTVNGVAAKGGSMGAAGPVVAGKRLFVPSGYVGVKSGMGGNVLLMFSP